MKVTPTALPGVMLVEAPVFADARGMFSEVYHQEKFAEAGLPTSFAQDNLSRSVRGVLRGLHYQLNAPQGKLVRPVEGVIFDVAVDIRRSSPTFGQWMGVTLAAGDGRQLWIPPRYAHGFLVLSERADVLYKCTTVHDAPSDRGIRWDDAAIGIQWPVPGDGGPLLSQKDLDAPLLGDATVFD